MTEALLTELETFGLLRRVGPHCTAATRSRWPGPRPR